MKIKHQDCHIELEHPFTNCKLGREKYANILTQIVGNYKDGFVLAINNEWGTGKTTFVKMWQQQLTNKGYNTLYFNSWENDFDANPLVAVMAELNALTKKKTEDAFKSLIKKGAIFTKNIIPSVINTAVKKYTGSEDIGDLTKEAAEATTETFKKEIDNYTQKKIGLKEFKESLEKFITETNDEKPLIFIIDELDRCRPTYAVELLEQIKHLFSVPGIVFVLSIDKIQLGHAVRGVYGSELINADEYLRRFIDVEYTLPQPSTKDFCSYLYNYFEFDLFIQSDERKRYRVFSQDQKNLITVSSILFEKANLTLRQQEKIFAHSRIGFSLFKPNEYVYPGLFLTLVFLKNFHLSLYEKIKSKEFTPQELVHEYYDKVNAKGYSQDELSELIKVEAELVFFYKNYISKHSTFSELIEKRDNTEEEILKVFSRFEIDPGQPKFLHYVKNLYQHGDVDYLPIDHFLNKTDLLEPFTEL